MSGRLRFVKMQRWVLRTSVVVVMSSACSPGERDTREPRSDVQATAQADSVPERLNWQTAFGVAAVRDGTLCVQTERANVPVGAAVLLVPGDSSKPVRTATVTRSLFACGARDPDREESAYALSSPGAEPDGLWIAVFDSASASQPRAAIDIDRDGEPEQFRTCNSVEGTHLSVWSGPPRTGTRRWHAYDYVGFKLEPTCTEAET